MFEKRGRPVSRRFAGLSSGGAPLARLNRTNLSRALLIGLIAAVALTACGRKGALEAPPDSSVTTAAPADTTPPAQKPNKRFVLDPLLGN